MTTPSILNYSPDANRGANLTLWTLELVDGRTVTIKFDGYYSGVRYWDGEKWTDVAYRRRAADLETVEAMLDRLDSEDDDRTRCDLITDLQDFADTCGGPVRAAGAGYGIPLT